MSQNGSILSLFAKPKPIIGMLHLKGEEDGTVMERLKREIDLYVENGVDGVIVEGYFGTYPSMVKGLEYVREAKLPIPYGVNCLHVDAMGFELAMDYDAAFLQLDSVIGHLKPRDEASEAAFLDLYRSRYQGKVMGGVRFKYMPVKSANTVEEDLVIAKDRCDAVCVTQDATGQETSIDKIRQFRGALGDFPLFVAAGLTPENVASSFAYADGAIAGSYFKDTYKDTGDVCAEHVRAMMDAVNAVRSELND